MVKNKKPDLPGKTVERLSKYRRVLFDRLGEGKANIYSHELAEMMNLTSVQVRRDLMLIGYSGSQSTGYAIEELIEVIGNIMDSDEGERIAIIGMGDLGRSITNYFKGKREKLKIVASFDNNQKKIGRKIAGVPCYDENEMAEIIKKEKISIAVITVPSEATKSVAKILLQTGIKGIFNYTAEPLTVPEGVYLEEYDIITSLEKLAFFVKE